MKKWQKQVIADAASEPDASYAALSRWCGVHVDTLRKARLRDPEFAAAITNARAGTVGAGDIVDPESFFRDKQLSGLGLKSEGGVLFPRVLDHLIAINSGDYSLAILAGGIGSAKTVTSVASMMYQAYVLLSQDDPHEYLGLDPSSPVLFVCQNRTARLSKLNAYALFRNFIERSPWFAANQPHDARLKSRVSFLKRNVEIWPVGDAESVLGMNVYCGLIDEANFHDIVSKSKRSVTDDRVFDGARESFEGLVRRKLSRLDEDKGIVFVSSSRRYRGEFTSQLADEFGTDARCYQFDETCWSINPEKYADGDWFSVFQGDQQRAARIMAENEETHPADRDLLVRVPRKFYRQYKNNVVRSLQDLSGIAVARTGTFFTDRELVNAASCLDNRLMRTSDAVQDARQFFPGVVEIEIPQSPRACHADLSLSGDLTGLCVAHISGYDDQGRQLVTVDALGRIHPPGNGGQIDLDSIFQLIRLWREFGVPIQYFSCDGFQSSDLMQRVAKLGVRVGKLSVDQTSPGDPCQAYEVLRLSVAESRVRFPQDSIVVDELLGLEHDRKRNRIDHPPSGSKDSADALAGAVYQLSRIPAWQLVDKVDGAGHAAAVAHVPLGGTVTPIPSPGPGVDYMALIRQQRGMPAR